MIDSEKFGRQSTTNTAVVVLGSLISGLGVYVFQVLTARSLGEEAYAPIGVMWTIQSLAMATVLLTAEMYVAREIALVGPQAGSLNAVFRRMAIWIAFAAVGIGSTTWWWQDSLFGDTSGWFPVIMALTLFSYGAFMIMRGYFAGSNQFIAYGGATSVESLTRVVAAIPIALAIPSTLAFAWTFPVGPVFVIFWWLVVFRRGRGQDIAMRNGERAARIGGGSTVRYLTSMTVANVAAQILLTAGPLVLVALGATSHEISVFFISLTLSRIPTVIVFGGLLSRILPPLTQMYHTGDSRRLRLIFVVFAGATPIVGGAVAIGAGWLGPAAVRTLFGSAFEPEPWLIAVTASSVTIATVCFALNQVFIATDTEDRLVVPWLLALAAGSLMVVAMPGTPTVQVATGLLVGELVALAALAGTGLVAAAPVRSTGP